MRPFPATSARRLASKMAWSGFRSGWSTSKTCGATSNKPSTPRAEGGSDMSEQSESNVLALIGNTPMVRVGTIDTGPCELFLKLESQNPGGSIKDRIGLSMIEAAERDGLIRPGSTLVEATAGNTGLALALVAARKGYRLLL